MEQEHSTPNNDKPSTCHKHVYWSSSSKMQTDLAWTPRKSVLKHSTCKCHAQATGGLCAVEWAWSKPTFKIRRKAGHRQCAWLAWDSRALPYCRPSVVLQTSLHSHFISTGSKPCAFCTNWWRKFKTPNPTVLCAISSLQIFEKRKWKFSKDSKASKQRY